jgi:hypothetical protein
MTNPSPLPSERLEEEWTVLREQIRRREVELAALLRQFRVLDEARALLIMRACAGEAVVAFETKMPKLGLRDAVLSSVAGAELGIRLRELCEAVIRLVDPNRYSTERSLEAAVQTTVRRLILQGEVSQFMQDGVRKYVIGPTSALSDEIAGKNEGYRP